MINVTNEVINKSVSLNEKVAPPLPSALFSAHILPPWASTMPLEINNPNPDPVSDLVANFENNLSFMSGSIPVLKMAL